MRIKNYLLIFLTPFLVASKCSKDRPAEQLPPETQTGAGTLGFKANGTIHASYYPYPNAFATYIHLNFPFTNQGYFFSVGGGSGTRWNIGILTDSLEILQGQTYKLNNNRFSKGFAHASFINNKEYYTKPYLQGELIISKLDQVNKIVSGTFWFDAVDTVSNTTVKIREGRFDLRYTE